MKKFKLTGLAALLGLVVAGCLPASVLLTVAGSTNVFLAGQAATTGCATSSPGCAPTTGNTSEVDFVPTAGNVLTIFNPSSPGPSWVTGGVSPGTCTACVLTTSGDGFNYGSMPPATNITSGNNISGIQFTGIEMFLVGVFLGPTTPASPVANLPDYAVGGASNNGTFNPLVGQAFFIGDGLTGTGSGALQQFVVPTGATRLFLGFADAPSFSGLASMYGDNSGSLSAWIQIQPASVPEPGTVVLMMVGLAALALGRKKLFA